MDIRMVTLIAFALIFLASFEHTDASVCNGVICKNMGTVATDGTSCWCSCDPYFVGTQCETMAYQSSWPNNEYALPMSVYGCPETSITGWQAGYLSMTFRVPLGEFNYSKFIQQDSDHGRSGANDNNIVRSDSSSASSANQTYPDILGYVDDFTLQMSFCSRHSSLSYVFDLFPYGDFSVFGHEGGCPQGLQASYRTLILPPILFLNRGGRLPYLNLTDMGDHTRLEMLLCVKENNDPFFREMPRSFIVIKDIRGDIPCLKLSEPLAEGNMIADRNDKSDCSNITHRVSYRHPLIDEFGREFSFCVKVTPADSRWDLSASGNIVQAVIENEHKCNLTLGMRDMHIQDYQITVSSSMLDTAPKMARPQYAGWCSGPRDLRPYVQVDLLLMTIVEGIIVTSWVETTLYDTDVCTLAGSCIATNNFDVAFSMTKDFTKTYFEQKMSMDIRRRFNVEHTFWFIDRQYTRYVRLYPHRKNMNHIVCMKFELIGCRVNGTHSLACTRETNKAIYDSEGGYVPVSGEPSEWYNYTLDQCKDRCRDVQHTDCGAIEYSAAASTCRVHGIIPNHYDRVKKSESFDYFGVANCIADPFELQEGLIEAIPGPGHTITSIGYPFEYTPTYIVILTHSTNNIVKIVFTHIALRASQSHQCTDTIEVAQESPFPWHITSKHNGLRPMIINNSIYRTLVFFNTCPKHPTDTVERINGFRAYILPNDISFCNGRCSDMEEALLQSSSFQGFPNEDNHESKWTIEAYHRSDYSQQMTLVFDDVNINCQLGSKLYIVHRLGTDEFCNRNRPAVRKTYYTSTLRITFSTGLTLQNAFVEGFRIWYLHEYLALHSRQDWYTRNGGTCISYFGKCYYFFNWPEPLSWTQALDICISKTDGTLVNIKSKEENKVVRDGLLSSWFRTVWENKNTYAHIDLSILLMLNEATGLSFTRQCHTYQRNGLCALWTDGTPVSYTAWEKYHPRPGLSSRCTVMDFTKQAQNSWIQSDCEAFDSQIAVHNFACETTNFEISLSEDRLTVEDGNELDQNAYRHLYKCVSGEYVSPKAVCNSLSECHDSSDEIGCNGSSDQVCDYNMFMCDRGKCVHISALCDYVNDCEDGTDEYCTQPMDRIEGIFYCSNKEAIVSSKRCDGVFHCMDKSDESNCDKCNPKTAFFCDYNKCLPLRYVCDHVYDCVDQSDEASCDHMSYRTCDDVVKTGITASGHFKTAGEWGLICDFDNVTMTMTFVNIDWWVIKKDEEYGLNSFDFIQHALEAEFVCFQNFTPVVRPIDAEIAILDNITYNTFDEALMKIDQATNLTSYNLVHSHLRVSFAGDLAPSLRLNIHSPFDFTRYRIPSGPVICKKDIPYQKNIIACGENLNPVDLSHRCLYSRDVHGQIEGCKNMAHLQKCGDFVCPSGYVKCPDSFCIPAAYVCNMQLDCPFGEDETNCWCSDNQGLLYVIHNNDQSLDDILLIVRLFVGVKRTVYILKIENQNYTMNQVRHPSVYPSSLYSSTPDINLHNFSLPDNTKYKHIDIVTINLKKKETYLVENTIISDTEQQISNSNLHYLRMHIHTFSLTESPRTHMNVSIDTSINTTLIDVSASTAGQIMMNAKVLLGDRCAGDTMNVCNGGYVCKSTSICLPLDKLCDNVTDCPGDDDEMMCDFRCPDMCICDGLVVDCRHANITWEDISAFPVSMRSLDVSGNTALSGSFLELTKLFPYLYRLNVSEVGIRGLKKVSFSNLPNVKILDLGGNKFTTLESGIFSNLRKLKFLNLKHNKELIQIHPGAFVELRIKELSLHNCGIKVIEKDSFDGLTLDKLDLSMNEIKEIRNGAFKGLRTETLDISFNPIHTFDNELFKGIVTIKTLKTSDFKFCCIKPSSLTDENCISPKDEFSTCADLIGNPALQSFLWLLGIFAFVGNCSSIIVRVIFDKARLKIGYGIFVTNLAISDLLMGIYMLIIAVADTIFRNRYIFADEYWRTSHWCKLCGVLSTISSEASVLFICLITVDRIIAIKFPFSRFKFALKNSIVVSIVCWVLAISVAVYPILNSSYFDEEFYSSRAVCVALPLTRDRPPGWLYSFVIFIGFNSVAFVLIALGQVAIYSEVKRSARRQKRMNVTRSNELSIARSLFLVVWTDFMCWFPVGCMGFIALTGYPIPGEVYAWTVVLVMPINSAINPFLYTYSILISRKLAKQAQETSVVDTTEMTIRKNIEITQPLIANTVTRFSKFFGCTTLNDVMATRRLTITETMMIVSEVANYLNAVHDAGAVTTTLDPKNILINTVDKKIIRNIHVVDCPRPILTPTDQANDMGKLGSLASRMLKARMRQY